jgi:hypothetical protein
MPKGTEKEEREQELGSRQKRMAAQQHEFDMLYFSLSGSRIFFKESVGH